MNKFVNQSVETSIVWTLCKLYANVRASDVDLYFAPFDNVFTVSVDPNTGIHNVSIDPAFRFVQPASRHRRHASSVRGHAPVVLGHAHRPRRHAVNDSAPSNSTDDTVYELTEQHASGLVTFVSVAHPDTLLIVRGVRNRLVIMLPNAAHQLKVSRFYLIVAGATNTSYGVVYFRQDQPHIDLFVFFSVFFSCFFLFLAGCVMLWKAKQVVDRQRSRHQRQIEMQASAVRQWHTQSEG